MVPTPVFAARQRQMDLRRPPTSGTGEDRARDLDALDLRPLSRPPTLAYQAALQMVDWGDRIGVATSCFPSTTVIPQVYAGAAHVAAAILAHEHLTVTVSAALVPCTILRFAEQLATIDCMAPGRLSVVLGAGYRRVEFAMADVDRAQRGSLLEECYEVCRQAWTGKPFSWRGREVLVTPTPSSPEGPHLAIGGKTAIAARRAARLRAPFSPATADPRLAELYRSECARLGVEPRLEGLGAAHGPGFGCLARP
jgi:alkanesulfonate monooxygenase SsuD/methylene tetrahydromethanopterin reductase-like flavin-dependent oxidoreductase (luciferase family)